MSRLAGKVSIITGGNAGIGESIARLFAREGSAVVVTGRRKEELERVVREIGASQGRVLAVSGSVADDVHVRQVIERTIGIFGKVDILVNNAGVGSFGKRIHELDDKEWHDVFEVNVTGVFRMTKAVIPHMLKQGSGSIINISSIASLVGIPMLPAYAASKGALDALTRALAIDYAQDGVRCNVVNPGLIDTPMAAPLLNNPEQLDPILSRYPLRRPGKPEEVAEMVLYLASDHAAWVTGGTFRIDGGMTVW
ncbi:MAG TPA: SDR family oxidoreductase [Nitrospira sp.]|nr:SDR family oxidoreductase [Nitrospira sp.]